MELQKSVLEIIQSKLDWCKNLTVAKIENQDQYQSYIDLQKDIKESEKILKDEKEKIYRPLKKDLDFVNSTFKTPMDILSKTSKALKNQAELWIKKQEKIEEKKVKQAIRTGEVYIPENSSSKELNYADDIEVSVTDYYAVYKWAIENGYLEDIIKLDYTKISFLKSKIKNGVKVPGTKLKNIKVQRLSV